MPLFGDSMAFSMVTERTARMSDRSRKVGPQGAEMKEAKDTAQQLCRTGTAPAPFSPTEEWIEAFDQQSTDEMRQRATRFARSRARVVARAGGRVDDLYVSELVHDALT